MLSELAPKGRFSEAVAEPGGDLGSFRLGIEAGLGGGPELGAGLSVRPERLVRGDTERGCLGLGLGLDWKSTEIYIVHLNTKSC